MIRTGGSSKAETTWRPFAGLALFACAYAILNYRLLVVAILYRAAANDYQSAALAGTAFAIQGLALLLATVFLPRILFRLLLALVAASAFVNITYADILNDTLSRSTMLWLFAESRQAGEAAGLFAVPALVAAGKTVFALLLLWAARAMLRPAGLAMAERFRLAGFRLWLPLAAIILVPSFLGFGPAAAERNVYAYSAQILAAPPPPPRRPVPVEPEAAPRVEKIVWLIDESISRAVASELLLPDARRFGALDFGEAAAIGNCSSPAHVALRSGLDVRRIDAESDLRTMPTIWAYARKAGFRTLLIDGQVTGPPQNMMLPTERALIDDYRSAAAGLRTDHRIARTINAELRTSGRQFIYAVLRGVHFQYGDHVPAGTLPPERTLADEYRAAVAYSKRGLFDALLAGIDRDKVAILYTSDHGQNVQEGAIPHCSREPVRAEFSVPLLAFLPPGEAAAFSPLAPGGRSASQIFPTTLQWMGYDSGHAQGQYDRDLRRPTARYVWLGRNALPLREGDRIDLHVGQGFPGR